MKQNLQACALFDRLKHFQVLGLGLGLVRKSLIPLITCGLALTACGGGGSSSSATAGGGNNVSIAAKPADLSLVVGFTQTFRDSLNNSIRSVVVGLIASYAVFGASFGENSSRTGLKSRRFRAL